MTVCRGVGFLREILRMPVRRAAASRVHFTVRTNRRFPVSCGVYYMGRDSLGKGTAVDLSHKGWRVQGDAAVRRGQWLTFRLQLEDGHPPVEIPRAIVRWTAGHEFGVEWLVVGPHEEQSLDQFIRSMAARL